MLQDIRSYIKSCPDCQSRKRSTQAPAGLLQPIPVDGIPWQRVGIDGLGPFKKSTQNNTYIIAAVCYSTKFLVAKAVPAATATEVAKFLMDDIICKYGMFTILHSDRGQIFKSNLVQELVKRMGGKSSFSTSFMPQSNGLIEHLNSVIAQSLSMYVSTTQDDWCTYLQASVFAYNTSIQFTTRKSPFFLNFCRQPVLPADIALGINFENHDAEHICTRFQEVRNEVVQKIQTEQIKQKERYDKTHRHVEFQPGDLVLLYTPVRQVGKSDKLQHCFLGPHKIISKVSDVNYKLQLKRRGKMIEDTVHVARLKKYFPRKNWKPQNT